MDATSSRSRAKHPLRGNPFAKRPLPQLGALQPSPERCKSGLAVPVIGDLIAGTPFPLVGDVELRVGEFDDTVSVARDPSLQPFGTVRHPVKLLALANGHIGRVLGVLDPLPRECPIGAVEFLQVSHVVVSEFKPLG